MSNHHKVRPIVLDFKPSRRLTFALACLLFSAFLIVLMMPMIEWLRLVILAASLPIVSYVLARDVFLSLPHAFVRLELTHQGEIKVTRKNGKLELAQVMPSSYVTSNLTILHLKLNASRWPSYLLILPDSAPLASFRRLRAWLLWGVNISNQ